MSEKDLHNANLGDGFQWRQRACAERLRAAEEDVARLGEALHGAMSELAGAFSVVADELGGRDPAARDAAIRASQFQDVGGQWLGHLASQLRRTREILTGDCMTSTLELMHSSERPHPVAHAEPGSMELF